MKVRFILCVLVCFAANRVRAQKETSIEALPASVYSGPQANMHVQGIAVDKKNGFIYFSFTDRLLKTDYSGKLLASVVGFFGHLGDLEFDPITETIYGSLEYKSDAIGKSISNKLGKKVIDQAGFYVVVFDAKRITEKEMNAEQVDFVKAVYIKEAVDDFNAKVKLGERLVEHRFGCSGIDGIALAPSFETPHDGKKYLYLAYGIYGDTSRIDNDNQVILKYDISNWGAYAQKLSQDNFHQSGPAKPDQKYFLKTGNSNWGIQNLAYDEYTNNFYAAVYKGKKSSYPNYDLFVFSAAQKPTQTKIDSDNKRVKVATITLLNAGLQDSKSGTRGWRFKWGSTGITPLGDGYFYISHNKKSSDGKEESTLYKYKWVGTENLAFERVK
jgi:hypothetical protein